MLVDRYHRFVYAVITRHGVRGDAAADLFQTVWLDAYNDLPKLRQVGAFRGWLGKVTAHACYHAKQRTARRDLHETGLDGGPDRQAVVEAAAATPEVPAFVEALERDQLVRDALRAVSARCQKMIHLLFFAHPPRPYAEVASELGLAVGSIGFIRARCLERLRSALDKLA